MTTPLFSPTDVDLPAPHGAARLVSVDVPGGVTTPEEFASAAHAAARIFVAPGRAIVLSGRAPVWGYAMLLHLAHPSPWVATVDPRLGGAVVVQSHTPGVSPGEVLKHPTIDQLIGG